MAKYNSNISVIKSGLWTILVISAILEMMIYAKLENLVGCAVTFASTALFFKIVLKIDVIRLRPIAFIALLQLFLFMYLPLPVTLLDGNEMSHELYNPNQTYILQFLYFCTCLLAFYISGLKYKKNKVYALLNNWGYFDTPSHRQLWILGFIGLAFRLSIMSHSGEDTIQGAGTLNMFSVLIYCPITILFGHYFGWKPCNKTTRYLIYFYIVFLVILLIATNSRSQMLSPIVVLAFCYLLGQICKNSYKLWLTPKKVILICISTIVIVGPASDMATAMVIVRSERTSVSIQELFNLTIDTYKDKEKIKVYRMLALENSQNQVAGDWEESYVSSPFLDRLCNYRVADLTIYHAEKAGFGNSKMLDLYFDKICTMFPGPISKFLFPNVDKSKLEFSPMDYLYNLSTGSMTISYRVGGDVGLGLATFGFFYYILSLIIFILVFYILDGVAHIVKGKLKISVFTLISIYFTYFLIFQVGNGLSSQTQFVLWGFWWTTLWYSIIYKIIRMVR